MEPPQPAPALPAAALVSVPHLNYPDSVDSSPRSRNTDSWDEQLMPPIAGAGPSGKLRLMCSFGGHIVPRPHDKSLWYVGGETRMIVVERQTTLSDLTGRLSKTLLNGRSFTLKYQLPSEDLDSLISVTTDEDIENMIEEYDRLISAISAGGGAQKSSRLRLFLFPSKPDSASSIGSLLENSTKSEDWFLNALNGTTRGLSDSVSVNCLLGLDDDVAVAGNGSSSVKDVEAQLESFGNAKGASGNSNKQGVQDVQSVPDSPMLETTSSFGSTSSSPSLANLPPIPVPVEDHRMAMGGIDEQFSQMMIGAAVHKQDDGGFLPSSSQVAAPGMLMGSVVVAGEYSNRIFSDDERSEQGMPVGYRKPSQSQPQPQPQPPQSQTKQSGGVELQSPDSVSSDGSVANPLSRQRPLVYQDTAVQIPSGNNRAPVNPADAKLPDPNARIQVQHIQDSGYVLPTQFNQQHQQLSPQQQAQYIQAGTHYIHHHNPTGAFPIASFYPLYASQQQHHHHHPHPHPALDQQYPVYYMPARQPQAYNLSVQQSNYSETAAALHTSRPQTPPSSATLSNPTAYNPAKNVAAAPKPEMAAGVYRTATGAPQFIQVPSSQHQPQYIGFSQINHPSQSVAPTSAAANYNYDFADPANAPIYYARQQAPQLATQHQTVTSSPAVVLPEASAQLPVDSVKHQFRTSQPQ